MYVLYELIKVLNEVYIYIVMNENYFRLYILYGSNVNKHR